MSLEGLALLALLAAGPPEEEVRGGDPSVEAAIEGAVAWLVANQRPTGAFGSHHSPRPIEVLCDVPASHHAFRVATTSLCLMALRDAAPDDPGARAACDRAVDYLLGDHDLRRVSGMEHYHVWGLGYLLQAFGQELVERPGDERAPQIRAVCGELVRDLERSQALDGGWGYLSIVGLQTYRPSWTSMSFTTATMLVGLRRAADAGVPVPEEMLRKALDSVARCRTAAGAYTYGEAWNKAPISSVNNVKGAACRTPACQHALVLFGREVAQEDRTRALDDLFVKHARFQRAGLRRPIPHESWYGVSGYFYLYGHAYAARELEGLPPAEARRRAAELVRAVLVCRQPDGSFWDYPLYSYHKPYGTAYALIALERARRLQAPAAAARTVEASGTGG